MERAHSHQRRLQRAQLGAVEPGQIVDRILRGLRTQFHQQRDLFFPRGHQQLAQASVRDPVLFAVLVQRLPSQHTQPRLPRSGRIIDPGVNHLRVARAGVAADAGFFLEHHDFPARAGQGPRHGQPHHARANYCNIDLIHRGKPITARAGLCAQTTNRPREVGWPPL